MSRFFLTTLLQMYHVREEITVSSDILLAAGLLIALRMCRGVYVFVDEVK